MSLRVDGKPTPWPARITTEGSHEAQATLTDHKAGNTATATRDLYVDHTPPADRMVTPDGAVFTSPDHQVTLDAYASDPRLADGTAGSGVSWAVIGADSLSGGPSAGAPAQFNGSLAQATLQLQPGRYQVAITAWDVAGNAATSAPITITVQ
jgi:hypothetical protein